MTGFERGKIFLAKCVFLFFPFIFACDLDGTNENPTSEVAASAEIAARAFDFAKEYQKACAEYAWGAQDSLRKIKIDCSGLVVMCYSYAIEGTGFSLVQSDMSASFMAENASYPASLGSLRRGDLIFMGEEDSKIVSHIALFERAENGRIYFIDSTQKDEDGDGILEINGVSSRSYEESSTKFKSFGVMKLLK